MEDWQKDFTTLVETVTSEFEEFIEQVGVVVESVTEEISEAIETATQQIQDTVSPDLDQYFQELFEPFVEIYVEFEDVVFEDWIEESEFAINPKVEPSLEKHPACIGCSHYHGRIYGENLLVCGMHPYGWDDRNCPDWQGK